MSTALVFLHGWGLQPTIWSSLSAEFEGFSISAPSLRPDSKSLSAWADDLSSSLPARCVLVGWSLGAMLAMCIAERHPTRLRGLILFSATPCFVSHAKWQHGLDTQTVRAFREAFQRDPQRTQQRFLALQTLGDAQRTAVSIALQAALTDTQQEAVSLSHGLRLLASEDLREHRPPASLRALLIHGENDALIPVGAARWLSERWPASQLYTFPETGHAPFLSQPLEVAEHMRRFLRGLPA